MSIRDFNPQFLYHYTTVENLALILKNKTIKFTPLDSLDDKTEGLSKDAEPLGRFVYVSCWTDDSSESIPMWNMYSSLSSGVRIKLKSYPFKKYDAKDYSGVIRGADSLPNDSPNRFTLFPPEILWKSNYVPLPLYAVNEFLYKITYTNDDKLLCPHIIRTESNYTTAAMGVLGKYKDIGWEFQKEYRYVFIVLPEKFSDMAQMYQQLVANMYDPNFVNPISLFSLDVDDIAFSDMEVTLCPKISTGNRAIVELMKTHLNPSMKIIESTLAGKLR